MTLACCHPRVRCPAPDVPFSWRDPLLTDNYPEPGKRPLSSIATIILEYPDGSFYLAIGGSGGSRIFSTALQTLLNLDWGMDASEAVEYGRVHDQLYPEYVAADNVLPQLVLDDLRNRKHTVKGAFGVEQPCPMFAFIPFGANVLSIVMDVNRVAGVAQIVVSKEGKIYGGLLFRVSWRSMDI